MRRVFLVSVTSDIDFERFVVEANDDQKARAKGLELFDKDHEKYVLHYVEIEHLHDLND